MDTFEISLSNRFLKTGFDIGTNVFMFNRVLNGFFN